MSQRKLTVSSDGRLGLSAGACARPFAIGNSWTKIRIGARICFPASASLSGSPIFAAGVCNGPASDGYSGASCVNFIGLKAVAGTWTFAGTPGTNGYFGSLDWKVAKKIAGTETLHASNLSATLHYLSATESLRSAFVIQIEKGSPNYLLRMVGPNNGTGATTDVSEAKLTELMEMADDMSSPSSILTNYSLYNTNNTLAMDESAGDLDHVNIYWNRSTVECQLSEVKFRMVA